MGPVDLSNLDSHFSPFKLNIGAPIIRVLGNVYTNFCFFFQFRLIFELGAGPSQTERRTDGRTSKARNATYFKARSLYRSVSRQASKQVTFVILVAVEYR